MNSNKLIECTRCGSDACFHQEIDSNNFIEYCMGCGFQNNSLMTIGSKFLEEQLEILPEIYKELVTEDEHGKIWIPSYTHVDGKGTIFANGTSKDNWKWNAAQMIEISEEEQYKYPIPGEKDKFYKERVDMKTLKEFDEKNFIDALEYINLL